MSNFLFRLGRWCARHPFKTIGAWILVAFAIFGASNTFGAELVDDYSVPGVESQDGTDVLEERFPEFAGASSRIVFHTEDGRIDDPENRAAVEQALAELGDVADVSFVTDPYDLAAPTISADGETAFATIQFSEQTLQHEHYEAAEAAVDDARNAGVQTEISGQLAAAGKEVKGNEAVGLAVAIIVLLIAF